MPNSLRLGEDEWKLVLDILKAELDELPAEIHHSDRGTYRDELRQRKTLVSELMSRVEALLVESRGKK